MLQFFWWWKCMMSSMFKALLSLLTVDIILTCKYISRNFEILEAHPMKPPQIFRGKSWGLLHLENHICLGSLPAFLKNSHTDSHTHTYDIPHSKTLRPTRKAYVHSSLFFSSACTIQFFPKSKRWSPIHLTNWPHPNSFDLGRERGM